MGLVGTSASNCVSRGRAYAGGTSAAGGRRGSRLIRRYFISMSGNEAEHGRGVLPRRFPHLYVQLGFVPAAS